MTSPQIIFASSTHSSCAAALDLLSATADSGSIDLTFLFFLEEDDEDVSSVTEE